MFFTLEALVSYLLLKIFQLKKVQNNDDKTKNTLCLCLSVISLNRYLAFRHLFLSSIDMIDCIFFCIYWYDHILQFMVYHIDLYTVKNFSILGINPTWSGCMILLIVIGFGLLVFCWGFLCLCSSVILTCNFLFLWYLCPFWYQECSILCNFLEEQSFIKR